MGAQLAVTDLRQVSRYSVNYTTMAKHPTFGEMLLTLANISRLGFMLEARAGTERGDRLVVRLPIIGRIESFCIWTSGQRAGFQFERPIRPDDFVVMIEPMHSVKLRRKA